jgi:hypothetical protein
MSKYCIHKRSYSQIRTYPFSITWDPFAIYTPKIKPGIDANKDNWMFLRKREALVPFKTFSNQTPASPERRQAPLTANNPRN